MSDKSPQKVSRSRRLIIATVVLLMLAGGLWWSTRPSIDRRLVGAWISDRESNDSLGKRFNSDGTASECQVVSEGRPQWTLDWSWSVSGNVLKMRFRRPPAATVTGRMHSIIRDVWERLSGAGWKFEIVEVTGARLTIKSMGRDFKGNAGSILSYTRRDVESNWTFGWMPPFPE